VGAFERALALVSQYRREFPEGALSREADVLAIQALAEKGEKAEVARNARSFLARHPRDPQAARVKELGEEVSFPVE
jgi:outer membrane protein assembly factor BamD (BamD/ComL family)